MVSSVIPAKAGIQEKEAVLDPGACPPRRIRRGDGFGWLERFSNFKHFRHFSAL